MPCAGADSAVITTNFMFKLCRVFIMFLFYWIGFTKMHPPLPLSRVGGQHPQGFRVRTIQSVQKVRIYFICRFLQR
jgi:hypothetical protein